MTTPPTIDEKAARRFIEQVIAGAKEMRIKVKPDAVKWTVAKIDPAATDPVLSSSGLGKDDPGHTLDEAIELIRTEGYNCLGVKGGVLLAKKLWLVILDNDAPGAFEAMCKADKRFAVTFAQRGSRLGHLFVLTDTAPLKLSARTTGEMIGIEGPGGHVFAFSPHRNGKDFYKIERDAPLSFIPLKDIYTAIRATATELGGTWNSDPEKKDIKLTTPTRTTTNGGDWRATLERHRRHDKKLDSLLRGDASEYRNDKGGADRSAFDMAIACECAFYNLTQNDIESALGEFGSDKGRARSDYVSATAKKAIKTVTKRWVDNYGSGVPFVVLFGGVAAQVLIMCFMLFCVLEPAALFLLVVLGPYIYREWILAFAATLAYVGFQYIKPKIARRWYD